LGALGALQPDHRPFFRQGRALEGLQRSDEAEAAYRRSLAMAGTVAEQVAAHRAIASAARRSGRWSVAKASLVAAISLDPANPEIVQELADGAFAAPVHAYADLCMYGA